VSESAKKGSKKIKSLFLLEIKKGLLSFLNLLEWHSNVKKTVMLFVFWTFEKTSVQGFATITQK
jgi:hypothetical protein